MATPIRVTTLDEAHALATKLLDDDSNLKKLMRSKGALLRHNRSSYSDFEFENAFTDKFIYGVTHDEIYLRQRGEVQDQDITSNFAIRNLSNILACNYLFQYYLACIEKLKKNSPEKLNGLFDLDVATRSSRFQNNLRLGEFYIAALEKLRTHIQRAQNNVLHELKYRGIIEKKYGLDLGGRSMIKKQKMRRVKFTIENTDRNLNEEIRSRRINFALGIGITILAGFGISALTLMLPVIFPVLATSLAILSLTGLALYGLVAVSSFTIGVLGAKLNIDNFMKSGDRIFKLERKKRHLESYLQGSTNTLEDAKQISKQFLEESRGKIINAEKMVRDAFNEARNIQPQTQPQPIANASTHGIYAKRSDSPEKARMEPVDPNSVNRPGSNF